MDIDTSYGFNEITMRYINVNTIQYDY